MNHHQPTPLALQKKIVFLNACNVYMIKRDISPFTVLVISMTLIDIRQIQLPKGQRKEIDLNINTNINKTLYIEY